MLQAHLEQTLGNAIILPGCPLSVFFVRLAGALHALLGLQG